MAVTFRFICGLLPDVKGVLVESVLPWLAAGFSQPKTFSTSCEPCPKGTKSESAGGQTRLVCNRCFTMWRISRAEVPALRPGLLPELDRVLKLSRLPFRKDYPAIGGHLPGRLRVPRRLEPWLRLRPGPAVRASPRIEVDGTCTPCREGLDCPVGSTLRKLKENTAAASQISGAVSTLSSGSETSARAAGAFQHRSRAVKDLPLLIRMPGWCAWLLSGKPNRDHMCRLR